MNNILETSNFLDRYKDFSKRLERQKIIHYKTKFNGLFNGFDSLRSVLATFDKKESFSYNIFDVLNIGTAEVITHTPFLINLLNPNGSHGQANLFLESFIHKFIPKEKKDYFILTDINDYHIEEEKPFQNGRIDIYIQSIDTNQKFVIIIENKLLAGDQQHQLKRYFDFLKARNFKDEHMMMFYLTIEGNDPSPYSINTKLMNELNTKEILKNLSYKIDIKEWLQGLMIKIESDKMKFIVQQYLKTIDKL